MAQRKKQKESFGFTFRWPIQTMSWAQGLLPNEISLHFKGLTNIFLLIVTIVLAIGAAIQEGNWIANVAIFFVLAGIWYYLNVAIKKWLLQKRWLDGVEMNVIDEMPGHEFEEACAEIYRRLGYKVKVTKRTRDQGADLIMEGPSGRVVVQAKRQASAVGNWAVQEICAAKGLYKASHAVVITNNTYTIQARELADANAVKLVDRNDFVNMLVKTASDGQNNITTSEYFSLIASEFLILLKRLQ